MPDCTVIRIRKDNSLKVDTFELKNHEMQKVVQSQDLKFLLGPENDLEKLFQRLKKRTQVQKQPKY